ncbi:unnamed protein product [Danaus chrysippus]|uniref:(African queen) hypothetical protein n=1 Tax=Danaus chrysippus TaxID=151541 RepID=A0A8J2QG18_9NEOP|nr:unnamed protein product [Danaus chrysippus]
MDYIATNSVACNKEFDAVIEDGGERCVRLEGGRGGGFRQGLYRDCIGEQTSGRGVAVQIILPPGPQPTTTHVICECVSMATARAVGPEPRAGPCMILVRETHLRLFRERERLAREIKNYTEGCPAAVPLPPGHNIPISLEMTCSQCSYMYILHVICCMYD